jgi:DNA-binding response OmpR family regulator
LKSNKIIWIIEDDPSSIFVYEDILTLRYQLKIFKELKPFIEELKNPNSAPDLLISDLRLGADSFLDFLTSEDSLKYLTVPFIVVSGIDDLDVLQLCFNEGAIDYLTKPFAKTELLVKINRLLNRNTSQESLPSLFAEDEILLDPYTLTLTRRPDMVISLTLKELQIYSLLSRANQKSNFLSRTELIQEIWRDTHVSAKSLDVHIYHLRKKLQLLNIQLVYLENQGYSLKVTEAKNNELLA